MTPEDAAIAVASSFRLSGTEPVVLSDTNNLVLWLRPTPVVAKVATGHHRRLGLELAVAKHLRERGAPIVPPAGALPQEVHQLGGFEITFWEYQQPDPVVSRNLK